MYKHVQVRTSWPNKFKGKGGLEPIGLGVLKSSHRLCTRRPDSVTVNTILRRWRRLWCATRMRHTVVAVCHIVFDISVRERCAKHCAKHSANNSIGDECWLNDRNDGRNNDFQRRRRTVLFSPAHKWSRLRVIFATTSGTHSHNMGWPFFFGLVIKFFEVPLSRLRLARKKNVF